jgi:hypothetical protein
MARFYDFNVWTERKRIKKLRYIHRNPVVRGFGGRARAMALEQFSVVFLGRSGSRPDYRHRHFSDDNSPACGVIQSKPLIGQA